MIFFCNNCPAANIIHQWLCPPSKSTGRKYPFACKCAKEDLDRCTRACTVFSLCCLHAFSDFQLSSVRCCSVCYMCLSVFASFVCLTLLKWNALPLYVNTAFVTFHTILIQHWQLLYTVANDQQNSLPNISSHLSGIYIVQK